MKLKRVADRAGANKPVLQITFASELRLALFTVTQNDGSLRLAATGTGKS